MKIPAHEEILISRCRRFEPEALKTLSQLYGKPAYGFIRSMLGAGAETAHNSLIRVMADSIQDITPFNMEEPFLVTVMRNLIEDLTRHCKLKAGAVDLPGLDQKRRLIFEALSALSWDEKILLLLRDQMDFDFDEMESILSRSSKILKNQLQETRLHFRSALAALLQKAERR